MKKLFNKILCPVSFDENSIAALEVARTLAQDKDAVIYLLHVVPTPPVPVSPIPLEPFPQTEHDARARLRELAETHLAGKVRYEMLALSGDPAHVIIRTVADVGADSIVMATHGRKGVSRFFLGSVAERVVRESPCPVLTVRGKAQ
jgi:nucleotide-binding universal stress UspA family protein